MKRRAVYDEWGNITRYEAEQEPEPVKDRTPYYVTAGIAGSIGLILAAMWAWPQYMVYSMEMHGRAVLAEAESSRQVAVREALALKDSAQHKAAAERIRAQGVADANRIIADGLGGPEGYLRYLWIDKMATGPATVYIPTEANIPITEAGRFKP